MDVYKLYGAGSATADNVASLDIRHDGHIVAIAASIAVTAADALNDGFSVELSFGSTGGIATNDTTASLLVVRASQGFLTSGGGGVHQHQSVSGIAVPVSAGERLYLHALILGSAGPQYVCTYYVYVIPTAGGGRTAVRRR